MKEIAYTTRIIKGLIADASGVEREIRCFACVGVYLLVYDVIACLAGFILDICDY